MSTISKESSASAIAEKTADNPSKAETPKAPTLFEKVGKAVALLLADTMGKDAKGNPQLSEDWIDKFQFVRGELLEAAGYDLDLAECKSAKAACEGYESKAEREAQVDAWKAAKRIDQKIVNCFMVRLQSDYGIELSTRFTLSGTRTGATVREIWTARVKAKGQSIRVG